MLPVLFGLSHSFATSLWIRNVYPLQSHIRAERFFVQVRYNNVDDISRRDVGLSINLELTFRIRNRVEENGFVVARSERPSSPSDLNFDLTTGVNQDLFELMDLESGHCVGECVVPIFGDVHKLLVLDDTITRS